MSRTPAQAGGPGATPGAAKPAAPRPAAAKPGAPAPVTAKPGAPAAAAPAKAPTGAAAYLTKPNLIKYGSIAGGIVVLVGLLIWKPWLPSAPRLNEPVATIARFAASSSLNRLTFDHQRQYMELLDEKDDGVVEAYEQGKLTDQEFRRALQLGWYGEHLKKMDNFYSKPPTLRAMYLDKQVDKKRKKKNKEKSEDKPDSKAALTADEIERDDSTEEQDIKRWPADVRQRWNDYRTAWAARKQYWKDLKDQQKDKAAEEAAKGAEAAAPTGAGGTQ